MKTSSRDLAAEYGVTERHIVKLATAGTIPGLLVGGVWRFDAAAVREALEEHTRHARQRPKRSRSNVAEEVTK